MNTAWGEEGEGGMYVESNMETYATKCKIDSQWEFAVWLRGTWEKGFHTPERKERGLDQYEDRT